MLVIDDYIGVSKVMGRMLEILGFASVCVGTEEAALPYLGHPALQAVICDGSLVLQFRQLRQMLQDAVHVPLVITSGLSAADFDSQQPEFHYSQFLAKPFDLTQLATLLQSHLG